jgi:hypothetical protein
MPAAIRRERLLADMHPCASAACGASFTSSKARKQEVFGAPKTGIVFVDAQEAKPDILVRGQDVFSNSVPLAEDVPKSSGTDPSEWWYAEFCSDNVKPNCALTVSSTAQGSKLKGAIVTAFKVPAAAICAVVSCVMWVLMCVVGMGMGLMRAVGWAISSFVRLPVRLVRAVAGAVWVVPQRETVCEIMCSDDATAWWWREFCSDEVMSDWL